MVGSIKYKAIKKPPFRGSLMIPRVKVIDKGLLFDRMISLLNLVITALLAGAALWIGYIYNENERLNRDRENVREERRDAVAARLQMQTAVATCIQYNIDLSRQGRLDPNPLARIALAEQIANYTVNCGQIGRPIDGRIAEAALNRLSASREPAIARAGQRALRIIRRQRSSPPPSLREKADAYRALSGRVYYANPVGLNARGRLHVLASPDLDHAVLMLAKERDRWNEQSAQPADRFFAGETPNP